MSTWPKLRKPTEWGPARTTQHAIYSDKARWVVRTPNGLKYEHILVWEKYHGRKLPRGWVVHHKDENPLNNDISNLEAMPHAAHNSIHRLRIMKSHVVTQCGSEGKKCKGCGATRTLDLFAKNGRSAAGTPVYRPTCRDCDKLRQTPPTKRHALVG